MRASVIVLVLVVASLLAFVFFKTRPAHAPKPVPPTPDTVSSEQARPVLDLPVVASVCVEQLDAAGAVTATYEVKSFTTRDGATLDCAHVLVADIILTDITAPDGSVTFETTDGKAVVLQAPWKLR